MIWNWLKLELLLSGYSRGRGGRQLSMKGGLLSLILPVLCSIFLREQAG